MKPLPKITLLLLSAFLASCATGPTPIHGANSVQVQIPLPVFELNGDGDLTVNGIGSASYDVDVEQSGFEVGFESFFSEAGDLSWVTSLFVADFEFSGNGGAVDGEALILKTGPRYYFMPESGFQPFVGGTLGYSPELDVEGLDYGSFAYLSLGGGGVYFISEQFSVQAGLDYLMTIVDPEYTDWLGTDKVAVSGLSLWLGGGFYF